MHEKIEFTPLYYTVFSISFERIIQIKTLVYSFLPFALSSFSTALR